MTRFSKETYCKLYPLKEATKRVAMMRQVKVS